MAMTMQGEVDLPAPRETVWAKLNDPEVLKACIPGCQSLEKTSDTSFEAVAKIDAVTTADVRRVAGELAASRAALALYGPVADAPGLEAIRKRLAA